MITSVRDYYDHHTHNYHINVFVSPDNETTALMSWKEKLHSMLEQVPDKADRIKPLIQLIVAATAPTKIFMMQHPDFDTAKKDNYIDLLIVIPPKNRTPFSELQPILDMAYVSDWRVSCSLHDEGTIIDGLRNGHVFYSLHCIPDNLVYDDKLTVYPITSPEILKEIKTQAQLKFEQSFSKALNFLDVAIFLQQNHAPPITAFMLHQAAELTFRGILQSLNGYDKKTHEIRVLRKMTRRCAPQLTDIFSEDSAKEKRLLALLDSAYAQSRYENDFTIPEEDLAALFKKITLLQEAARAVVVEALTLC